MPHSLPILRAAGRCHTETNDTSVLDAMFYSVYYTFYVWRNKFNIMRFMENELQLFEKNNNLVTKTRDKTKLFR